MSRFLSDLLGASEPFFTQHLNRLENESGRPGVDLYLASDISKIVRQRLRELALDPNDTKGKELYHALQNLIKLHDEFLAKRLGIGDANNTKEIIDKIIEAIPKLPIPQTCWAIKPSAAKRLLLEMPPKHVMKQLHYRSVDSLLKRANIDEVFAAIHFAEATSWQEKFMSQYRRLEVSDFETRRISVIAISPNQWASLLNKKPKLAYKSIIRADEFGVIAVIPPQVSDMPGLTLTLLPLIIHHVNEMRQLSSYLKLIQVKPDFINNFTKSVSGALNNDVDFLGQPLGWSIVHKYFGKIGKSQSDVFMPYVQPDDLAWKLAEDVLYKLEPALKFWHGLDFVGAKFKSGLVSMNLLDNALSYCNKLEYSNQSLAFFREALSRELYSRYLAQQPLEEIIIRQFDTLPDEADTFTLIEREIF